MMKTTLLAVLLLCMIMAIDSCSSSSTTTTDKPSAAPSTFPYMIGRIEVIGNEPFTKLALRVDETHLYLLRAPKEMEPDLVRHQQGLVKLYYSGRQEKAKEHYLDVDHIEKLDSKK
ncbi:MAG: hypothetical protein ACM3Q4_15515 [Acidobacteriota bacterium]